MEKDTIITLDDNTTYALLDETIIDNKTYFFALKLDENNNPTTEYEIFENEEEDGEIYMNILENEDLKQSIMVEFTNNYMKLIDEI